MMSERHRRDDDNGFPLWLNATVLLGVMALLGYNIVVVGPEGYPTSMMLGGLVAGYAALDRAMKRKKDDPPPSEGGGDAP